MSEFETGESGVDAAVDVHRRLRTSSRRSARRRGRLDQLRDGSR